jgi:hypothetical protein
MKILKIIIFVSILLLVISFIPLPHKYCAQLGCSVQNTNFWSDFSIRKDMQRW